MYIVIDIVIHHTVLVLIYETVCVTVSVSTSSILEMLNED